MWTSKERWELRWGSAIYDWQAICHLGFHQLLNYPIKRAGKSRHFMVWKHKAERKWLSLPPAKPVPVSMRIGSWNMPWYYPWRQIQEEWRLTANDNSVFWILFQLLWRQGLGIYGSMTLWATYFWGWLGWLDPSYMVIRINPQFLPLAFYP